MEGRLERGGDALLEHGASLGGELVAGPAGGVRVEGRGVALDFVSRTAGDGRLVTLSTSLGVEQRPKPRARRKQTVEHDLPPPATCRPRSRKTGHRTARL